MTRKERWRCRRGSVGGEGAEDAGAEPANRSLFRIPQGQSEQRKENCDEESSWEKQGTCVPTIASTHLDECVGGWLCSACVTPKFYRDHLRQWVDGCGEGENEWMNNKLMVVLMQSPIKLRVSTIKPMQARTTRKNPDDWFQKENHQHLFRQAEPSVCTERREEREKMQLNG